MFGWSMFLGLCGAIAFLASGVLFVTEKQKQKLFPRVKLSIVCLTGGCTLFVFSYYFFYWHYAGRVTTPPWLDQKMIYRVGGQAEIEEQNAVFLGNAKKDVWCVSSDPLGPGVGFVRVVKTSPPESKWVLKPVDVPQQK